MDIDERVVWRCIEIELKKMMFRMKEMEKHKAKQDRINRRNAETETENENEDLRNKKQKMETETETQKTETATDMEKQKMKTEEEEDAAIAKAPRPSFKPPRMDKYMPMYCTPNSARLLPGTFQSIPVDPCSTQLPPPEPPVAKNFWGYDKEKHKAKKDRINRCNAENEDLRNEKQKMDKQKTETETQKTATDMEKMKMKTETEMNQQEEDAIAKAPRMDKYRPMYCTPNSARLLPGTFQCIPVDPCSIPWPPPEPSVPDNFWGFWLSLN